MPTYVYQVILEDGIEGPTFEIDQPANEPALKKHPVTGHEVRRVITPPNIASKYTSGREKRIKDNKFVEKAGFTKYEKDKLTGKYHRVAGKEGPEVINPD